MAFPCRIPTRPPGKVIFRHDDKSPGIRCLVWARYPVIIFTRKDINSLVSNRRGHRAEAETRDLGVLDGTRIDDRRVADRGKDRSFPDQQYGAIEQKSKIKNQKSKFNSPLVTRSGGKPRGVSPSFIAKGTSRQFRFHGDHEVPQVTVK